MIIAGIDPSLSRTAIVTGDLRSSSATILGGPPQGTAIYERFARYKELADDTLKVIGKARWVFIEGYSYGSKGRATVTLGEYGGYLRGMLLARDIEVIEVAPSMLKKFVTGKGNAGKPKFMVTAAKLWEVDFDGEDEYFAYALFRLGLAYLRHEPPARRWQGDVVATLRQPVT